MSLANSCSLTSRDNVQILHINNAFAEAQIALFGGHILSYKPKHDGRERLWVSQKALFDGKKSIRGGIPVCWPWFGEHKSKTKLAAHGYVRTQNWHILNSEETDTGTSISLQPETSTGEGFTGKAQLTLVVHVGEQLTIQLCTRNLDDKPFVFNCALHSYFAVADIQQCELLGLTLPYADKTRGYQMFDTPHPYRFSEETDRIHHEQPTTLTILDKQIKTEIISAGHDSIVVWNPWQEKSIRLFDMADSGYQRMLCIETAITQGRKVDAQSTHILEQVIK